MVFAHGIGGAADLPISAGLAVAGSCVALAVSFLVLALAWRSPRYDPARGSWPLPAVAVRVLDSRLLSVLLRAVGLVVFCYVAWAALAGPDLLTNPTFGVVYVLLWVGLVPVSVLWGSAYRAVNPVRTIHLLLVRASGGDPDAGLVELPRWVGLWPASLGLLAFVWLELVSPASTYLGPVRLFFAVHLVVLVVGALVFGQRWIEQADPFEAYSTLVGRLSVLGRRRDGTRVLRSPLANLDATPARPGLVAMVAVLLGSTAFDSFSASTAWLQLTQGPWGEALGPTVLGTVGLLLLVTLVALTFSAATMLTGVDDPATRPGLPGAFAHSLVPIVVGYVVAHYLSYLLEVGQQTVVLLSDPLARGQDLLGTGDWAVSYWLSRHPQILAELKVLAVVSGHVLGVVSAHDRAVRLLPPRHRLTGQLPLLVLMVVFTVGGLSLLFSS